MEGKQISESDVGLSRLAKISEACRRRWGLASLPHTKRAINEFAYQAGVAPGIVAGRMQKEGLLDWTHLNGLKIRFRMP